MPYEISIKIDSETGDPPLPDLQAALSELNRRAARALANQNTYNILTSYPRAAIGLWYGHALIQGGAYPPGPSCLAAQRGYLRASEFPGYATIPPVFDRLQWEERIWPGSSDLMEMLSCIDSADDPDEGKGRLWAAAKRYSRRILPEHLSPMARSRLREMGAASEVDEYSLILKLYSPMAIVFVIENSRRVQTVRLGEKWVKGRGGKKWRGRPCDLTLGEFFSWVQREACRACEAAILGLYPGAKIDLSESKGGSLYEYKSLLLERERESGALHYLLAKEADRSSDLRHLLTRREHRLFELLSAGRSASDAAAEMGISESTKRVYLHQIHKKLSSISNG